MHIAIGRFRFAIEFDRFKLCSLFQIINFFFFFTIGVAVILFLNNIFHIPILIGENFFKPERQFSRH